MGQRVEEAPVPRDQRTWKDLWGATVSRTEGAYTQEV